MEQQKGNTPQTGVAVVPSVPNAIEMIDQKIAALKHIQDSVYKTPGKIKLASGEMDIKTQTNKDELIRGFASVMARIQQIEAAYAKVGITSYAVVKVDGGTLDEWISDIKLRGEIIDHKETLETLNGLKKEWMELLDKEDRKAILAEKMRKFAES